MTKDSIADKLNEKQRFFDPQRWGLPLIAIIGLADRLRSFWSRFRECFTTKTHDTSEYAFVRGLLTLPLSVIMPILPDVGRLGKVDMGQVGVALGYYKNSIWSMVDTRLYLPEEWFDKEHEKLAIVGMFQSTVGLKMIKEAKAKGMPFEVVGCDTTYKYRKSSFCHDGAIVKDTNPSFLGWVKSAKVQISFLCIVSCKKVVCRLLILLTLI